MKMIGLSFHLKKILQKLNANHLRQFALGFKPHFCLN